MPDPTNDQSQSQSVSSNKYQTTETNNQTPQEYVDNKKTFSAAQDIVNEFETDIDEQLGLDPGQQINVDLQTKTITEAQEGELASHDVDMLEASRQDTDVDSLIEAEQSWMEDVERAVAGGIAKGTMTFLENVGYIADIPQWFGYTNSFEEGYTNWLSEWASENKKEIDENYGIYGDDMFSSTMRGLNGLIDSTIGFAGIGAGAGQFASRGAFLLNKLLKAGYVTEAAIARIGTAAATNYAESTMMAAELHENVFRDALQNNKSYEDAVSIANQQAKDFIWQNKINVATDMFTLRSMSKGQGILSGAMDKNNKQKIKEGLMDAASEAFEEVSAGFLQKENERDGSLELGTIVDDDSSYVGRAAEYATSEEGLSEAFMGAIGGPFQHLTLGAFNKGIQKAKDKIGSTKFGEKLGIQDPVNDPGEFTEEKPEFNMTPSKPVGRPPMDPVTKYKRINANVTQEEAEKYVTKEDWAAYEKEKQEWLKSSVSTEEYEKGLEQHEKEVKLWEQRKAMHEAEKEKYKDYVYRKKLGSKAQAKEDVQNFLKNDHDLRKKYNKALLDGDRAAQADIENQRFEGLFLRYAQNGMTEGLTEQLEEIKNDENSTDEQKQFADRQLKKMDQYKTEYMKEYNKHGKSKGEELFKLKRRIESTKQAMSDLNQEIEEAGMNLAKEIRDAEGKILSPLQTERMSLNAMKDALAELQTKLSLNDNAVIEKELAKKKGEIDKRLAEIDKEFETGKISEVDVKALDGYNAFETKSKQKADAWLTNLGYKKSYDYQSSPQFAKDLQFKNFNYLMNQIENDTQTEDDIAENIAMITQLDISPKQKKKILAKLDAVAAEIDAKEKAEKADEESFIKRRERYAELQDAVRKSSLEAWDDLLFREKYNYSKEDEDIAVATDRYKTAQAKLDDVIESDYQELPIPGKAAEFVDRASLIEQYEAEADREFANLQAAKAAKEQAIKDNDVKIHELRNQLESNKQQHSRLNVLRNAVNDRLGAYERLPAADAFEHNAQSFLEKFERQSRENVQTAKNVSEFNKTTQMEDDSDGDFGPPVPPEARAKTPEEGKGKVPPSKIINDIEEEKKELAEKKKNAAKRPPSRPEDGETPPGYDDGSMPPPSPKADDGAPYMPGLPDEDAPANPYLEHLKSKRKEKGPQAPGHTEADAPPPKRSNSSKYGPPPLTESDAPPMPDGYDPTGAGARQNKNLEGEPTATDNSDVHFPDYSEPGDGKPKSDTMSKDELKAGAQVMREMNDADGETLAAATSHLASSKAGEGNEIGEIEPTDFDDPDIVPPVNEEFNEDAKLNSDWEWSFSYQSTSSNFKGAQANNSGLVDWLETTTDLDKRNYKVRYEVSQEDMGLPISDLAKTALEKFANKQPLTNAELAVLPIRTVVYNQEGNVLKHGGKDVYGWMKSGDYDFTQIDNTKTEAVMNARQAIVDLAYEGGYYETQINRVGNGKLLSEPETRNDPRAFVKAGGNIEYLQLLISDGNNLIDEEKSSDEDFIGMGGTRGFVYLKAKDANGRPFPLKMNSRKLDPRESSTVLNIILNYATGKAEPGHMAIVEHVQGLTNKEILDLLVFEGKKSLSGKYPFHINFKDKKVTYGNKEVAFQDLANTDAKQDLANYIATMWRTTNVGMMNKPMSATFKKLDFHWFGQDIKTTELDYNDFLFNDEALSTNATFPSGRLFINPHVITDSFAQWTKVDADGNRYESKTKPAPKKTSTKPSKLEKTSKKIESDSKKNTPSAVNTSNKVTAPVTKIISGGQTGVDRIGLEVARALGIETGGTAPANFRTEAGPDPSLKDFGLTKASSSEYPVRTEANVKNSDGTVYFNPTKGKSVGLQATQNFAKKHGKPFLVNPSPAELAKWMKDNNIKTLNIAGNRASKLNENLMGRIKNAIIAGLTYDGTAETNPVDDVFKTFEKQRGAELAMFGIAYEFIPSTGSFKISKIGTTGKKQMVTVKAEKALEYADKAIEAAQEKDYKQREEGIVRAEVGKIGWEMKRTSDGFKLEAPEGWNKTFKNLEEVKTFLTRKGEKEGIEFDFTAAKPQPIPPQVDFDGDTKDPLAESMGEYDSDWRDAGIPKTGPTGSPGVVSTLFPGKKRAEENKAKKEKMLKSIKEVNGQYYVDAGEVDMSFPTRAHAVEFVLDQFRTYEEKLDIKERNARLVKLYPDKLKIDDENYFEVLVENVPDGAKDDTDIAGVFKGGIPKTYQQIFDALEKGETKIAGLESPEVKILQDDYNRGNINSKVDVFIRLQKDAAAVLDSYNKIKVESKDNVVYDNAAPKRFDVDTEEDAPAGSPGVVSSSDPVVASMFGSKKKQSTTADSANKAGTTTASNIPTKRKKGTTTAATNIPPKSAENQYYEGNITPEPNTVFVFGSNPEGRHGKGAAKIAKDKFGAIYGQGEGLQGNAYALPTKDLRVKENRGFRSISKEDIIESISKLYEVAKQNPNKQFKVAYRNTTEVSLNGYTGLEMIEMFNSAGLNIPSNIVFSKEWFDTGKLNLPTKSPIPGKSGSKPAGKSKHDIFAYNGPKSSTFTQAKKRVEAEKEAAELAKLLPHVPINIVNGLIRKNGGGFAEGQFYRGVVTISDLGNEGVAFHEGFHAVVDGYLTFEQRNNLFNEARKRFGKNATDLEIEEILAEEFREYMLSNKSRKVPSTFKWLYDMLADLINLFRGKKRRLFSKIRRGRFDYTPPFGTSTSGVRYSIKDLKGAPSARLVREAVDAITYRVVSFSGVRTMDGDGKLYENLAEVFEDVKDSLIDDMIKANEEGNQEVLDNLGLVINADESLDNWDVFMQMAMDELSAYDLTEKKDDNSVADTNEEDAVSGELNIKPALLYSGKDNASNNTKLMVAMLRDPNAQSDIFGRGFEKLANFSTSWRLLENSLAGIVDTSTKTASESMLDAVELLATKHPEFNELAAQLKADDSIVPQYKKTQFYKAFSKQSVVYNNAIGTETNGEYTWKIGNADAQAHARMLRAEWNERFKAAFTKDGELVNKAELRRVINRYKDFKQLISDTLRAKGTFPANSYRMLSSIFEDLGMNISPDAFKSFTSIRRGKTEMAKFSEALKQIDYILLNDKNNAGMNLEKMLDNPYDDEVNFITEYSQMGLLAKNEGYAQKETLENMVMGPDGNMYWTKSLNNNITKQVSLWQQDPTAMNKLWNAQYHQKSRWLNYLMAGDQSKKSPEAIAKKSNERLENFGVNVFLTNRVDGGDDMGTSYSDLNPLDARIDTINRTLNGVRNTNKTGSVFSPLTMADKSSFYMFTGIPVETFNVNGADGYYHAVNVMYQYFEAEAERINLVVKSQKDGKKDTNIKQYSDAAKKLYWFPELSIGTELANKMDLYTQDGSIKIEEKVELIRGHIEKAIKERIKEYKQDLEAKGIISKNDNGITVMQGIDQNILSYYQRNTTFDSTLSDSEKIKLHSETTIDNLVSDFVLNSMVSNIEFTMLFAGDPAFYKDLSKRTPATIATGDDLVQLEDEPKRFKVAVAADIKMDSPLYDHYSKIFKERGFKNVDTILKAYKGMEIADGQAYITPERFRSIMRMSGKWQPKHEDAYKRLKNGENVDPEDLAIMQPLKGMHFELRDGVDQIPVPTYLKYSQAVLWPGLVKGTPMAKVLKQMETDKVDELVMASGIKVGATDITSLDSIMGEGEVKEGYFKPFELSNFHWKLQQDLPSKYEAKEKALLGSQARKNIKANIIGRNFTVDGNPTSGKDLAEMIDRVEAELSDLGKKAFNQKYGIVNGKITNLKPIYKHLEDKFKRDRVDNNVLAQIENNNDLDLIVQYKEKIEQELFAELNKATVKLTAPGGSFIQISGAGFNNIKASSSGFNLNDVIALQDLDSLQGPQLSEDGTVAANVFLPFKAVRDIPDWDKMSGAELKEALGDTIENLVGYRIPNQGMSSIDLLNVAGILPPSAGDSMVVYDGITAKTGSDFDIDKMYVMMHHTVWNPRTKKMERLNDKNLSLMPDVKSNYTKFQKKLLENRRMELWAAVLSSPDTFTDLVSPLDSDWLRNDANYIQLLNTTEDHKEFLKTLDGIETIEDFMKQDEAFKYEAVNDFYDNRDLKSLQFASPLEQTDIKERNTAGKAGVGQTANHLTHHVLMQQIGQAETLNENGDTITGVISAWLNAYVDIAKDPYISQINNNTFTANAVFYLLRQGKDPKFVNRLMSQPIIKEYVENHYKNQSKIVKSKFEKRYTHYDIDLMGKKSIKVNPTEGTGYVNAFDMTAQKFGDILGSKPFIVETDIAEDISAEELEKLMIRNNPDDQARLLFYFELIRKQGVELNEMVRASKFDTDGAGKSNAENYTTQRLVEKVLQGQHGESFGNIIRDTFVGSMMKNSHRTAQDIFGNLFMSGSNTTKANLNAINDMIGSDGTNLDVNKKIVSDFYSYVYSAGFNQAGSVLFTDIKSLFYGKKSMARKVRMMKEQYPTNKFLDRLGTKIQPDNTPSFVTFPSSKKGDRTEIDELWMSWEELMDDDRTFTNKDGETYTTAQFARELVAYSFAASGFNKNINSFFDLVPNTFMNGELGDSSFNKTIQEVKKTLNNRSYSEAFIDQFFRHNWDNTSLVPAFTNNKSNQKVLESIPGVNRLDGFKIPNYLLPLNMNLGTKKNPISKNYVRLKFTGEAKGTPALYKLVGVKNKDFYYERVSVLGMNEKGNVIKEYNFDNEVKGAVQNITPPNLFNKLGLDEAYTIADDAADLEAYYEEEGIQDFRKEEKNEHQPEDADFQYLKAPFGTYFKAEEYKNSYGETKYRVVSVRDMEDGTQKTRVVVREFDTKDEALDSAIAVVSSMSKTDLLLSLSSEC